MIKIEAIIQPSKFEAVKAALTAKLGQANLLSS